MSMIVILTIISEFLMTSNTLKQLLLCLLFFSSTQITTANEVDIVNVKANKSSDNTWSFAVSLKHDDEGWDHYANEWQVLAPNSKILATRTLYHPHVNEQPFTRGTSGVKIPTEMTTVYIIAKDTVHGLSSKVAEVDLKTSSIKTIPIAELKKMKQK